MEAFGDMVGRAEYHAENLLEHSSTIYAVLCLAISSFFVLPEPNRPMTCPMQRLMPIMAYHFNF
jgi:hypothetical protein